MEVDELESTDTDDDGDTDVEDAAPSSPSPLSRNSTARTLIPETTEKERDEQDEEEEEDINLTMPPERWNEGPDTFENFLGAFNHHISFEPSPPASPSTSSRWDGDGDWFDEYEASIRDKDDTEDDIFSLNEVCPFPTNYLPYSTTNVRFQRSSFPPPRRQHPQYPIPNPPPAPPHRPFQNPCYSPNPHARYQH